jgi:hypothetical protein
VLWIFAGGVAALYMPESIWFVGHLAEITEKDGDQLLGGNEV